MDRNNAFACFKVNMYDMYVLTYHLAIGWSNLKRKQRRPLKNTYVECKYVLLFLSYYIQR